MPLRAYASTVVEEVRQAAIDGLDADIISFAPAISNQLSADGVSYTVIDMRVAEQRGTTNGVVVVFANVVPPQHNRVMATGFATELTLSMSLAEIGAIIGFEGIDADLVATSVEEAKQYFLGIHKTRSKRANPGRAQ